MARAFAQIGKIAAVKPNTHRFVTIGAQFIENANGVRHAAFQRVIGIDEQQAGVGKDLGIRSEGRDLIREAHDPAVRVRSTNLDIKHLPGKHVARGSAAANHRGPCAVNSGVRTLRTAQAEFHNGAVARSIAYTARFGRNQGLMIDKSEHRRLDQLRLHDGRAHSEQRFIRKGDRSLRHGVDVAREAQLRKRFEKRLVKQV